MDFDVQIPQGDNWNTVARVRTDLPETYAADLGQAIAVQFQQDDNLRLARFPAVTTDRLRIVARRTTYGFDGDAAANAIVRRLLSNPPPPLLMIREIEVYGPPGSAMP